MKNHDSIVRTKTIFGNLKEPNKMYQKIEFMTFKKATTKMSNKFYSDDSVFEIFSYKWYDIRWTYQIPSYWLLLKVLRINEHNISMAKHKAMSITVLMTEIVTIIKSVKEAIKFFKR